MNLKDRNQRLYVAQQGEKVRKGLISRREFLRRAALAGFGLSAAGLMRMERAAAAPYRPLPGLSSVMADYSDDQIKWLTEVGGRFSGTTVRLSSESTAPSQITSGLIADNFTKYTGIEVQWEQTPLDQVLAKITQDTATENASNDIYYLDQSWVGRFVNDIVDTRETYINTDTDLNMPDYDFGDFVPELVPAIAEYQGVLVGVPFDIPIFIFSYRKDVLENLGLAVPTNMPEFMDAAKAIFDANLTNEDGSRIYGYVGQWKSGHYALQCDWSQWLWAHGGSHTGADGSVVINDDAGVAAAEYMIELGKYTDPGSTTYDWSGQGDAVGAGLGGLVINWGEFFPGWDNPDKSKVAGLMEPADLPAEIALRTKDECSFDETPGIGHQGGSCLALSKYSQNQDAAWVFLQWATSKETMALAAAQSNTPVRQSTFDDPRITALAQPVAGTTRHFPAILKAIKERMGTEPHFPAWADISSTGAVIPTELGLMTTGAQDAKTTVDNIAAAIAEGIAEG